MDGKGSGVEWGVSPDELPAVRAVGGLPQICGHKLMSVDLMDPPSHRPLALPGEMLEDAVSLERGCVIKGRKTRAEDMTRTVLAVQASRPEFKFPLPVPT